MNPLRRDIEELNYLGMRIALGRRAPAAELRAAAAVCAERKFTLAEQWHRGSGFPPLEWQGDTATLARGGAIVAVPHTGAYHRVPLALSDLAGVTLLLDSSNFEQERADWSRWAARYTGPVAVPMTYIDVTTPTAAWQAVRALRDGRLVVIYLDGNTGMNSGTAAATIDVQFFDARLRVRRGIGALAAAAAVPVIPLFPKQHGEADVVVVEPMIERGPDEPLEESIRRTMQTCYDLLAHHIRDDLGRWEEWYHVHQWRHASVPVATDLQDDRDVIAAHAEVERLRLSTGDTLVHLATGTAILATDDVMAALEIASSAVTVGSLVRALSERATEESARDMVRDLTESGFLEVR